MAAYYNEIDPYCAEWLRNLIAAGHIAPGDVDTRSIMDVRADDLKGYAQCHFFAGIGGWSLALRLAGWPDYRPVWTGSCPCQPFSAAGKGKAADDERHLAPAWLSLIGESRPAVVYGEQVEAAIGWGWLDFVFDALEAQGYACGAAVFPACGVGAPHIRQRLYFVADAERGRRAEPHLPVLPARQVEAAPLERRRPVGLADGQIDGCGQGRADSCGRGEGARAKEERGGSSERCTSRAVADTDGRKPSDGDVQRSGEHGLVTQDGGIGFWSDIVWLPCRDGKARPTKPGIFPLAHGVPARVGKLRAAGNAISPQVAEVFIRASDMRQMT